MNGEVLLKKQMLPVVRRITGDTYVFQQDSAPAHRARETVQLLQQETLQFISSDLSDLWPPNSPDLNPVNLGGSRVGRKSACTRRSSSPGH